MKFLLLMSLFFTTTFAAFAQAPVIEGDVMLCPDTNGTATVTNDVTYTTYQWYSKYWFTDDPYVAIDGATSASFTYDWFTYDQSLLKVVVTLNGAELESNAIQIDSHAWASLLVSTTTDGNVIRGEYPIYLICEGGSVTSTVLSPYTIAQWYKDGVIIEGATNVSYTITEPGEYYVVAGVEVCPNSTSTSLPISVQANPNCATQSLTPVIAGDTLLCPDTESTLFVAEGLITYDSYQWYVSFDGGAFTAIEDANADNFMFAANTYDQGTLKLVVTEGDATYESNTLLVNVRNWTPLFYFTSLNEEASEGINEEGNLVYLLCPGGEITNTLPELFSENIQWFRDGEPIEGANEGVYVVTEPGSYHAVASPSICPYSSNSTAGTPLVVSLNPDCIAGIDAPTAKTFTMYPNPANSILNIAAQTTGFESYAVYDVTGKKLLEGKTDAALTTVTVSGLSAGSYIVKLSGSKGNASQMFIKQ
ncbi:T9SS type A sorting domain-containing protein [Flavobacterium rivuli]|nr:T9SS type A sorting domain-containing protein [Flavobacterium rivuli]